MLYNLAVAVADGDTNMHSWFGMGGVTLALVLASNNKL